MKLETAAAATAVPAIPPNSIGLAHLAGFLSAAECVKMLSWFNSHSPGPKGDGRTYLDLGSAMLLDSLPPLVPQIHERMRGCITERAPEGEPDAGDLAITWIVRCQAGEGVEPHCDGAGFTFLIYLDTLAEGEGGETNFPQLEVKIRPKQGDALMWRTSAEERASQSGEALHEGVAVKSGVKTIFICAFKFVGCNEAS